MGTRVRGTAREALVLGGRGDLPRMFTERLDKLGHPVLSRASRRMTHPSDLAANLVVHLDTTLGDSREQVEPEHALSRARVAFDVIQRATATMKDRAFGRIVHVLSRPAPGSGALADWADERIRFGRDAVWECSRTWRARWLGSASLSTSSR